MSTNFSYAKDIRLFSMQPWLNLKHEKLHKFMHLKIVEAKNRWLKAGMINQLLHLLQQIILYSYLIYCVLYKEMSIANFTLYLSTTMTFFGTLTSVFGTITDLRQRSREVNDFRTFMEYPDTIQQKPIVPLSIVTASKLEFKFEHVSFQYPGQQTYALRDMNLTLSPGERLAVVGLNGAGKSTFIKLLCRLYTPTEGKILLNGIDIQTFDRREYYTLFAPVFQNIEMFAFPIDENVSMKTTKETDSKLAEECLAMAGLKEKLDSLDKGIKTELLKVLCEDGIDLSGGEKQKVAFARALYKNSPVVILDEPTSALDALAEYKLYQDFDRLIGEKSAVYISHRLSSTKFCHHVAMFDGGKMVEYGSHEELLKKQGAYAKMFQIQAQYYQERGGQACEEN